MDTFIATIEGGPGVPSVYVQVPWPTTATQMPRVLRLPDGRIAVYVGKYASGQDHFCYHFTGQVVVTLDPSWIKTERHKS